MEILKLISVIASIFTVIGVGFVWLQANYLKKQLIEQQIQIKKIMI